MTERGPEALSEDEATRVWAEAARRQADSDGDVPAMEFQGDSSTEPSSGYALEEVRAAAREAGIADEFMDAALADVRLERVAPSRSCNSASVVVEPLDVRCRRADRMTGRTEKISGSTITSRRKEPWVSTRKPLPI